MNNDSYPNLKTKNQSKNRHPANLSMAYPGKSPCWWDKGLVLFRNAAPTSIARDRAASTFSCAHAPS
jgi:hypothetical protein